jgi:hypothetical protein
MHVRLAPEPGLVGVIPAILRVNDWFRLKNVVSIASPHMRFGIPFALSMLLIVATTICLRRSNTLFCCWEYDEVRCL